MVWVYLKLPGKIKECTVNIYCIKWYLLECSKQDVFGNICSRHVKGGDREVRGQWCGVRMIPGEEEQIVKTHSPRKERKWANGWWVHIIARIHTHTNTDTHTHTERYKWLWSDRLLLSDTVGVPGTLTSSTPQSTVRKKNTCFSFFCFHVRVSPQISTEITVWEWDELRTAVTIPTLWSSEFTARAGLVS